MKRGITSDNSLFDLPRTSQDASTTFSNNSQSQRVLRTSFTSISDDNDMTLKSIGSRKKILRFGPADKSWALVIRLRRFLAFLLLLAAGLVSWGVYSVVTFTETESFRNQFYEDAQKVFQSYATSLDLTLGALDFMALNMASYARATNQTWPFVTIPDFAVRAEKTRALTNAVYLNLYQYVESDQRYEWEAYSAIHGPEWVEEGMAVQKRQNLFQEQLEDAEIFSIEDVLFWDVVHDYEECEKPEEEWGTVGLDPEDPGPFLPMWQTSPIIPVDGPYNWDLMSSSPNTSILEMIDTHQVIFTETYLIAFPEDVEVIEENIDEAEWLEYYVPSHEETNEPIADLLYPVIANSTDWVTLPYEGEYDPKENKMGAILSATIYWRDWFRGILPEGNDGVVVVQSSQCNPSFTYEINGPRTTYLGVGDLHDTKYDDMEESATLDDLDRFDPRSQYYTGVPLSKRYCPFVLSIYPSAAKEKSFRTYYPMIYTIVTGCLFFLAAVGFLIYDYLVEKRKKQLIDTANRTDAIVSNMLPTGIRERLYEEAKAADMNGSTTGTVSSAFGTGPIAQLYPSASIVFIDVAGFTAWSSTREPGQVFQLLETIYSRWDKLAYRYGVFKIETVGDCYVAAAGLPDPCEKHTIAVARFARDVLSEWAALTRRMELTLGPDTTNLGLRIGINSGQVTAGVLRGTMTRYQLFGDTVNTASRLQTTADRGKIQISSASADLIKKFGKEKWLEKNSKLVLMKGKGETETYLLNPKKARAVTEKIHLATAPESTLQTISETDNRSTTSSDRGSELYGSSTGSECMGLDDLNEFEIANELSKTSRLVEWNSLVLSELLQQILASRDDSTAPEWATLEEMERKIGGSDGTVLEEFQEIIKLPPAATKSHTFGINDPRPQLTETVRDQLRSYITEVASMYRDNHFHNFEHATHVTSSVRKLLTRIVHVDEAEIIKTDLTQLLTGHSYGITSDPLTQFTVMLSAIIHDCDHPGVPNVTLIRENAPCAAVYKKSIAEQNSVDLCWKLLMQPQFKDLRCCIYHTQDELLRFRQLLVNVVMATDIVDKELGALRKARWAVAFSEESIDSSPELDKNRKATIVLEHLIQASDVCHTMQHWDVYIEWNEKFFFELYSAYKAGRASVDPSIDWYKGEIGFFDFYVIPLAKKLDKCGVFGVSSHEYLDYAMANRDEWVRRGDDCVQAYLFKYLHQHPAEESKEVSLVLESV